MTDKITGSTGDAVPFSYAHDVHGLVSQLITDAGAVRASYGYDAYGGQDAPDSDPQALTTRQTALEAGLEIAAFTPWGRALKALQGPRGPSACQKYKTSIDSSALPDRHLGLGC